MTQKSERHKVHVAVYVVLEGDDKIFLLRRCNTGYKDGTYTFPAGHAESDEYFTKAAVRETLEEAGVKVLPKDLELIHTMQRMTDRDYISLLFKANAFQGEPHNAEPEKCDDARWFAKNQLPDDLIPEVRTMIEHVERGSRFSEIDY